MPPGEEVSFADYLARVERVRALRASAPVRALRVAEDDLVAHVERSFRKELPDHALRGTEEMLRGLGVVPAEFDFEQAMLSLLRSELAGLYDPRKDALFIRRELEGEELDATLLHELVHALQDQAYDLDEFSAYKEEGTDRSSALSALAEGDATSAMYDGMFDLEAERTGRPKMTALDLSIGQLTAGMQAAAEGDPSGSIPRIVRRSLLAPYLDGIRFVQELRQRGGWEAVNDAWKNPPDSTEQVLHVERFLARETPIATSLIAPPDGGKWSRTLSDVWGEQSVRLVFQEHETPLEASQRATDWGGDRIAAYADGEQRAVTWHLVTDTEPAAERYLEGFRRLLGSKPAPAEKSGFSCDLRPKLGPLAVARHGKHVLVLAGPYRASPSATSDPKGPEGDHPGSPTDAAEVPSPSSCGESRAWMAQALGRL